jgi:hypothetical protein
MRSGWHRRGTVERVKLARRLCQSGLTYAEAAAKLGRSKTDVINIALGRSTYGSILTPRPLRPRPRHKPRKYGSEVISEIRRLKAKGVPSTEIAELLGIPWGTVKAILWGRQYRERDT